MKIKQKQSKKLLWLIIMSLVVIVIGVAIYASTQEWGRNVFSWPVGTTKKRDTPSSPQPSSQQEATESTQKTTPQNTDRPVVSNTGNLTGKRAVTVVVSVEIDGTVVYIRGGFSTLETGGNCFAELAGPGGSVIRKTTTLLPNISTTDCKTIVIPTTELTSGKWNATLHYSADDAEGRSNAEAFTIP